MKKSSLDILLRSSYVFEQKKASHPKVFKDMKVNIWQNYWTIAFQKK